MEAIDRGGWWDQQTDHTRRSNLRLDGVYHCVIVANMPDRAIYIYSSSTNAALCDSACGQGWRQACSDNKALQLGLNIVHGDVVYDGWLKHSIFLISRLKIFCHAKVRLHPSIQERFELNLIKILLLPEDRDRTGCLFIWNLKNQAKKWETVRLKFSSEKK